MSLNQSLQDRLEAEFKPLSINAFSNCCRAGCSGTYAEDGDFEYREQGINFFRLHLNGMNYNMIVDDVYVQYDDFDYLMQNWEYERSLIERWAEIVGVRIKRIDKPEDESQAIGIIFVDSLVLEEEPEEEGPEEDLFTE